MIGRYLTYVSSVLILLPFFLGVYSYVKYGTDRAFNLILAIFGIWSFIEIYNVTHFGMNNHFQLNLNAILTTLFFVAYYCVVNAFSMRLLIFYTVSFLLFTIGWFAFFGDLRVWSMPYVVVTNIILVLFSAYSLVALFNREPDYLFGLFEFWIHTAVLIYFICTLIYLSFIPVLVASDDLVFLYNVHNVHSAINIIANLIYSYAFICRIRRYKVRYSLQ